MKYFLLLVTLVILASCAKTEVQTGTQTGTSSTEIVVEQETDNESTPESEKDTNTSVPSTTKGNDDDDEDESKNETLLKEVNNETKALDTPASNKLVTLDAGYKNPKGNVDMKIAYTVNEAGIIQSINATATTYDLEKFNNALQTLVGKTLPDAEKFYASGSSLTTDAFTSAIKNR